MSCGCIDSDVVSAKHEEEETVSFLFHAANQKEKEGIFFLIHRIIENMGEV